jgi:DNA-binding CsgD family transcriptional regulator
MLARGTPPPQLTARQEQVLRLVADGLTDAAIGHRLGCSPRTVDKHLEHVYRRLGVSCRTAAITAACAALMDTAAASGLQVQDAAALQAGLERRQQFDDQAILEAADS